MKHIPDEPVGWMSVQIRGRQESYPRNLPLVMRELWQQWLEDHPHRRTRESAGEDCPDCDETGMISIYRKGSRYLFRCRRCKRSNLNGVPAAFLVDLEAHGYTLTKAAREKGVAYG